MIRIMAVGIASSFLFSFWLGLIAPSQAHAACMGDWDLSGHWVLSQSNGYTVTLDLTQIGHQLFGTAGYSKPRSGSSFGSKTYGRPIENGSVSNNSSFSLTAVWRSDSAGVYTGSIDSQGHIAGTTYDQKNTGAKANWSSGGTAKCRVVNTTTPPSQAEPPKKPVKKLGKRLPGTSTTSDIPQSQVAKANDDVDIYKGPGGQFGAYKCGQLNCFLRKGETGKVLAFQDGWYKVQTNRVPDRSGWVAADHLTVTTP